MPDIFAHESDGLAEAPALCRARPVLMSSPVFDFDANFGREDRLTQAVTIFALLELYSKGEADWQQSEPFGPITVNSVSSETPIAQAG